MVIPTSGDLAGMLESYLARRFGINGHDLWLRAYGIDDRPIFGLLEEIGCSGWLVVEAEQDPAKATPSEYAETARQYIQRATGL